MRRWLRATAMAHFTRRVRPHSTWRARRAHRGKRVQLDGSHHDWFEGRGPRCVLMAYIDDASSPVYAHFYEYDGTLPTLCSFQRYEVRAVFALKTRRGLRLDRAMRTAAISTKLRTGASHACRGVRAGG